MMRTPTVFFIFLICVSVSIRADAESAIKPAIAHTPPLQLLSQYQRLKDELAKSVFGEPILLNSKTGKDFAQGEVYALFDTPFSVLSKALSTPTQWCELAILHINIKSCIHQKKQVTFFVGRKHYQKPDDAYALRYQLEQLANTDNHLNIKLSAEKGAFNTSNYLISLEAIEIDKQHSFIRFQYQYQFGLIANMAMKTYLATLGRNKVGFTVIGRNAQDEPIYIKGLQGVIERNVMRYIFAIQAVLDARKSPAEYFHTAEMMRWYAYIQKHPRQLLELSREEYMENKKRELSNQQAMQQALQP